MSGSAMCLVVGVALLSSRGPTGRPSVLAARRTGPDGGWEFPGGKVEPGESPERAAVREIREELGCDIEVTGWLPGESRINAELTLRVAVGRIVAGDPAPTEHDLLWWLPLERLGAVGWLGADVGFVGELGALRFGPNRQRFGAQICSLDPIGNAHATEAP